MAQAPRIRNRSREELLDTHMRLLQRIHDLEGRIHHLEEQLAGRNADLDQLRAALASHPSAASSQPIPRRVTR